MNLIIDQGNTNVKIAYFKGTEMVKNSSYESNGHHFVSPSIFNSYHIDHCIVSSVQNGAERLVNYVKQYTKNVVFFTSETPVPIKNDYTSASTLGSDRLAASVGANYLFPDKNVLIIDAGTCIKYNFVSDKNEFMGGGISPGLQMRFKALNDYTSRLPLISLEADYDLLIGNNTNNSILSGIVLGTLTEVEGIIEQYKLLYNNLTVVLTGGDINFFEKRLKKSIFADPNLILNGLNIILDYTINAKT